MTLREIFNAHKGYLERTYNDWRRTRWLGIIFTKAFSKDGVKQSDFPKLPGDDGAAINFDDELRKIEEYRKEIKNG